MAFSLEQINGQGNLPIDFNMKIPNRVDQGRILINTQAIEFLMRLTGIGILHINTYEDDTKPELQPDSVGDVTTARRAGVISNQNYITDNGNYLPGSNLSNASRWIEGSIHLNKGQAQDQARGMGLSYDNPKIWVDLIDSGVRRGILDVAKKHILRKDKFTDLDRRRSWSLAIGVLINLQLLNYADYNNQIENISNNPIETSLVGIGVMLASLHFGNILNYLSHKEGSRIISPRRNALNGYRYSFLNPLPQLDRYLLAQLYGRTNTLAAVKK